MFLIEARRERRCQGAGIRKPPSPLRLILRLAMVLALFWWLARFASS